MPSHPDPGTDVELDVDLTAANQPPVPEDLLAAVKGEGRRRRTRRHRRNSIIAGLALVAVGVPVLTLLPGSAERGDEDVRVAAGTDGSTTTTEVADDDTPTRPVVTRPAPSTTTSVVDESNPTTIPGPTPTTVGRPVTPVPPTAPPPTAPPCRNSTSSSCGEFRWDPAPGANAPLEASFVEPPANVVVGVATTFVVQWSDADAGLVFDNFSPDGIGLGRSCAQEHRYGPWDPPAPSGGSGTLSYPHTFATPGTYTVTVSLGTDVTGGDCDDPYANDRIIDLVVEVVAPTP